MKKTPTFDHGFNKGKTFSFTQDRFIGGVLCYAKAGVEYKVERAYEKQFAFIDELGAFHFMTIGDKTITY